MLFPLVILSARLRQRQRQQHRIICTESEPSKLEENPWQTQTRQLVYDNPWIAVRHDEVTRPDGQPGIYGVVHFKNKAIGVLPLDADGYTWLVGQYRYTLNEYSWEIPEGGCPMEEEPLAAARRELLEETGLTAAHWELLGQAHLSNSVSDEAALYYLATGLTQGEAQPEGTEKLQVRRVPFTEALRMVRAGGITDALSVIAILAYALRQS
ncbi:MAG: NUDIX hydrolase [Acidobacteria bacterium]|nr:NUDIX hydrolase [Acidobacteriota bacterium]MBI3422713.1 NUDIX hydrolase [Acidobacteriota bacterium]